MGLTLLVGALAHAQEEEPDGEATKYLREQFAAINRALQTAGLARHHEPDTLAPEMRWSEDLFGYSNLHYLRRIAAHLAHGRSLPAPGDDDAADDPLLIAYFEHAVGGDNHGGGWLDFLRGRKRPRREYDHLIVHSDAEGFYVPIDFDTVVINEDELDDGGGMLGSSQALLRECDRLAIALGIPPDMGADAEELWEACESQGAGTGWRRYGMETLCCLRLREGAKRSVRAGSALHFT